MLNIYKKRIPKYMFAETVLGIVFASMYVLDQILDGQLTSLEELQTDILFFVLVAGFLSLINTFSTGKEKEAQKFIKLSSLEPKVILSSQLQYMLCKMGLVGIFALAYCLLAWFKLDLASPVPLIWTMLVSAGLVIFIAGLYLCLVYIIGAFGGALTMLVAIVAVFMISEAVSSKSILYDGPDLFKKIGLFRPAISCIVLLVCLLLTFGLFKLTVKKYGTNPHDN